MKILLINSVFGIKSTGRIAADILEEYEKNGWECKAAYGRDTPPLKYKNKTYRIGGKLAPYINAIICRFFDNDGFMAVHQTKRFIKWANSFNPDIVWLHNLHGYYINIKLLFKWIKSRPNMEVKWTLHDCWAFTGHCSHFSFEKCYKWNSLCHSCPLKKEYPSSWILDMSRRNYLCKKKYFLGVNKLTIITPSFWLKRIVEKSFLCDYPIVVKHNTIDKSIFKRTPSTFKKEYNLQDKVIILGVASSWSKKKGFYDFIELSKMVPDNYNIVLVGLDKKQLKMIPKNILGIGKTNGKKELAEIYSAADVFLNLTYEDTYPTVNLEAQACGTPCITYNTGGSPESVESSNVVSQGDLQSVVLLINSLLKGEKNYE